MKESVKKYLEDEPKFRERKNKDAGIVNLLMMRHPALYDIIKTRLISRESFVVIMQEYATMDRSWRDILLYNEELRGEDYDDKLSLEDKKKKELGYGREEDERQRVLL